MLSKQKTDHNPLPQGFHLPGRSTRAPAVCHWRPPQIQTVWSNQQMTKATNSVRIIDITRADWKSNTSERASDTLGLPQCDNEAHAKREIEALFPEKFPCLISRPDLYVLSFKRSPYVNKSNAQLRNTSTVPLVNSFDRRWTCTVSIFNKMDFGQLAYDVLYWKSKNRISLKVLHFLCWHSGELFSHDEGIVC